MVRVNNGGVVFLMFLSSSFDNKRMRYTPIAARASKKIVLLTELLF